MATHDPEEVDLRQYLRVLFHRRWWAIAVFLVVLIVTAFITFTTTPIYKSTAEIMIRQSLSSEGLASVLTDLNLPSGGGKEISNQINIITGQATLERARDILGSDSNSTSAANGTTEQETTNPNNGAMTVGEIRQAIQVKSSPGTDIVSISALSPSPLLAMKTVSAVVSAHQQLDHERTIAALVSIRGFLSDQIDTVQKALDDLEEELIRFQQESGLLLEQSLLINKVTRIEQLLVEAQVELKDSHSRLDTINKFLEDVKGDFLERLSSEEEGRPLLLELSDKVNFLVKLQNDIAELEAERSQYLEEENYAQVQIFEQKIISERETLEETASRQFTLFDMVPQYENLIQIQLDVTLDIEALQNRVSILDTMRQEEINTLLSQSLGLSRKKRELDIAQAVYDILLAEYQKAQIAEAGLLGNIEVLNPPGLPGSPIKPRKEMNLLIGAVLGLF
ncbi:hypothetical protein KAV67_00395, partial [Candidatus Bipolaricaulota bacterium]|nr:hypothetical protein [Candidatus Bipolaricaulota bacterium]